MKDFKTRFVFASILAAAAGAWLSQQAADDGEGRIGAFILGALVLYVAWLALETVAGWVNESRNKQNNANENSLRQRRTAMLKIENEQKREAEEKERRAQERVSRTMPTESTYELAVKIAREADKRQVIREVRKVTTAHTTLNKVGPRHYYFGEYLSITIAWSIASIFLSYWLQILPWGYFVIPLLGFAGMVAYDFRRPAQMEERTTYDEELVDTGRRYWVIANHSGGFSEPDYQYDGKTIKEDTIYRTEIRLFTNGTLEEWKQEETQVFHVPGGLHYINVEEDSRELGHAETARFEKDLRAFSER